MKKTLCFLLMLAMLVSLCAPAFADGPDYTTGTPWLCSNLEGVVTADTPTDLKDDFYLAVNKDRLLTAEFQKGFPLDSAMVDVSLELISDLRNMFLGDAPEGHDARLAYDLFWLMMDWDSRNALGVTPLKHNIDTIEALDSLDALTGYFLEVPMCDQLAELWSSGTDVDMLDPDRYTLGVGSTPLLLGDSAEYSKLTDLGAIEKAAYTELFLKMLGKLGYTDEQAARKVENCLAFETLLAPAIYTNEETLRPDYLERTLNYYSLDELREAQGRLPILEKLKFKGFPEADVYVVINPAYLEKLSELYTDENLTLIKDYLIVHGTLNSAPSLDRECYEWFIACSNAISGADGMLDDETAFASNTANTLGGPVARLYSETYLKQEDKDRIGEMIAEILDAYHGIIEDADFLSDETRAHAIEKLDAIKPLVLFPDSWDPYSCEELDFRSASEGGTLWEAIQSLSSYNLVKAVKEYSEPVNKEKWAALPTVVNCGYDPTSNAILILGAFARGNIYNSDMSDEELLGKLGFVIGHEISHAFDSSGAQFDKDGRIASWWTEEDYAAFQARNAKMVDYYNAIHPWEGQDLYGSIVTGEAGADMAGIKVVLRIASSIPDFDYDAFFRACAEFWFEKSALQYVYSEINDEHPLPYLRINCTLQQFDEFLDFYGITEGDNMYLAPENRVNIW